jgi:hypothetical protein
MTSLITLRLHGFGAFDDRFRPKHHARPTTERTVVNLFVFSLCPIADVVNLNVHNARVNCSLQQALAQVAGEHFRKQGQNINSHIV